MVVVLLRSSFNTRVGNRPVTGLYGYTGYPIAVASEFSEQTPIFEVFILDRIWHV